MKEKKQKKEKRPMSAGKKILLGVLLAIVAVIVVYFVYYLIHYKGYNEYRKYLHTYDYETGTEYSPISRKTAVNGMDLISESANLRLYADTATGCIAVEDKRDGSITYSNPVDPDADTVANSSNKNYLKSQFLLYYYNQDVKSGSYDSYSQCVQKKQLTCESIDRGIRFIYTIGDTKVKANATEPLYFIVPLEYRLNDDNLEVSIPTSAIQEFGHGAVYRIQLLRYMGASSYDDEGYIVVPNAAGSIINFNNGKKSAAQYSQYIYEIDPMASSFLDTENVTGIKLPLFAMCRKDRSLLATIEEGATSCVITAGVSGMFNDLNYCFPIFVLRNIDNLKAFGNATTDVYVMEEDIYDINCTVRYTFINEGTGYSGVASYYRDRLVNEGVLAANKAQGDIPFYYDVLCDVSETRHFLGVQYLANLAMTTCEEAGNISDELKAAGIGNQVMNLEGWFNGGYYQKAPHTINLVNKVGSRSDLEELQKKVTDNGGRLYAEVAFQKITYMDSGFSANSESSRYYGAGYVATFGQTNPTTLQNTSGMLFTEIRYNLLSPKYLPRYIDKFTKKIAKYDIGGLSLRDLGDTLASDKRRTNVITREEALDVVLGQFDKLKGTGKKLMTSNTNSYAFAYSSDIINAPTEANNYAIIDAEIPLYEMIIHGYIDYSSTLLNFTDLYHKDKTVLTLIEHGAAPHYVFTHEESSLMKDTAMNHYYSTTFSKWKDDAVSLYNEVNSALKYVNGATMINHEIADNGVRRCTYDNGVSIYVNYGDEELAMDGISVPAKSWRLEGVD